MTIAIGDRFGRWTVVDRSQWIKNTVWPCVCDCGTERLVMAGSLTSGRSVSCGCIRQATHNLFGKRYGRLLVIGEEPAVKGHRRWLCECDCGTKKVIAATSLRRRTTKSCGCLAKEVLDRPRGWNFADLTGKCFGRLTVIRRLDNDANGHTIWLCQCECGNECQIEGASLTRTPSKGRPPTRSCGCLVQDTGRARIRHGHARGRRNGGPSKEYNAWQAMKQRCNNPNSIGFKHYGGRGINVCDPWNNDFVSWLDYKGPIPQGVGRITQDRINPDGNYEPGNVKWATTQEQARNKRPLIHFPLPGGEE